MSTISKNMQLGHHGELRHDTGFVRKKETL